MPRTMVVVPCYNESRRLQPDAFVALVRRHADIDLLFVNDGSTDSTAEVLSALQRTAPRRMIVHNLPTNAGKAEAVRQGVLRAFEYRPSYVGFWDADLATPLDVIPEFQRLLDQRANLSLVIGSRVSLLGRQIERNYWRHLLGRSFATVASLALGVSVYDTQCGAKLFRATPAIQQLFAAPFRSRWIFDVEILARMIVAANRKEMIYPEQSVAEFPLQQWTDVAGSKLRPGHFLQAAIELSAIYWTHRDNLGRRGAQAPVEAQPADENRRAAA